MKTRSRRVSVMAGVWLALAAMAPVQALAATCYWDGTTNGWTTAHWTNTVDGGPLQAPGVGTNYVIAGGVVNNSATVFPGDDLQIGPGGILAQANLANTVATGTIAFAGGTLKSATGNPRTLKANNGFVVANATTSTVEVSSNSLTLSGALTGEGTLNKVGNNSLFFATLSPSFTGTVNVSEGTIGIDANLPDARVNVLTGGMLWYGNAGVSNHFLALNGGTINHGTASGEVSGYMTVAGRSHVSVSGAANSVGLAGTLAGGGDLDFINGAALNLAAGYSGAGYTGALVFTESTATLNMNNLAGAFGGLSSSNGYGRVGNGNNSLGTLTLQPGAGKSYEFSGTMANNHSYGKLAVTMAGSGTQILSGPNTFTDTLRVNSGTLLMNNSLAAGPAVTNYGGAFGGTGTVYRQVEVRSGATLAPGAPAMGALTVSSLTMRTDSAAAFDLGSASGVYDSVIMASNLTFESGVKLRVTPRPGFGGGTYTLFTCSGTLSGEPELQPIEGGYSARLTSGGGRVELAVRPRGAQVVVR